MSRSVIVVGGGAAGLAAANAAAEQGAAVTLLERLPRVGKKILLTGNGRCNLGHAGCDFSHYHGTVPQAKQLLSGFDAAAYFRQFGLLTRTDSEGRIYPLSNSAASVLDALRLTAEQRGVRMLCGMQVTALRQKRGAWQVSCGEQHFAADTVILAAGGCAAPNCGTDGNLLPLLREMGYTVTQPRPALCPIPTDPARVKALKGLRVRAEAAVLTDGTLRKKEAGEVQFTDSALSGICIFNLSRLAALSGKRTEIALDLLPELAPAETLPLLQTLLHQRGAWPAGDLLTGLLPKRVGEVLLRQCGANCNAAGDTLSRETLQKLSALLRDWRFPVTGTASFAQAQVTAGGVAGQCVTRQLESKLHAGLYFCGEILDLDGDCGGYNLAWSWVSGKTAGESAVSG